MSGESEPLPPARVGFRPKYFHGNIPVQVSQKLQLRFGKPHLTDGGET